jgi:hypothetical protein
VRNCAGPTGHPLCQLLPSSAAVTVAAAATNTSGTTGAGVTPGIEAVAVGMAWIGVARWVGVGIRLGLGLRLGLGVGLMLGLALGLSVDGDGLAADAGLEVSELAASVGLDAELAAEGFGGADGAPVAAEIGAELPVVAVLCPLGFPLVQPAIRTSAPTHMSDAPRSGVICSG